MLKLHLGRFFTKEGGIGGLAGGLRLKTGPKEDVEEVVDEEEDESPGWMRHGRVRCAGEVEADMRGNMLPDERGGVSKAPAGVAWVEEEADAEEDDASSGKGYSNFSESVLANGVQTF